MNTKQTITVIGAISREVLSVCEKLAGRHYRLILCGDEKQNMVATATKIQTKISSAEVEVQDCMIDASWEADIIIVAAAEGAGQIAETIREVANQKIVMLTNADDTHYERPYPSPGTISNDDLQQLLPNSKLVRVYFTGSEPGDDKAGALMMGNHTVGLSAVADILKEAGCHVIVRDDFAGLPAQLI